jgi:exopolyphosphatase/guanosine-5'-triphosphate,3'-diphosphate pyrophosphatase
MLNLVLTPGARRGYNANLKAGAITSALDLAARYHCDMRHSDHVTNIALKLFEKLRKRFSFSLKQNLLLTIACILHESGHFTNSNDALESSFDLVKDAHIYGLNSRETLLAANIIVPQSLLGVTNNTQRMSNLDDDEVLFAAKMHAILHLADSLDYSQKQKAKLLSVILDEDRLIISVQIHEDFSLEQLMFKESALLFQEIFGIAPRLKINNIYQIGEN